MHFVLFFCRDGNTNFLIFTFFKTFRFRYCYFPLKIKLLANQFKVMTLFLPLVLVIFHILLRKVDRRLVSSFQAKDSTFILQQQQHQLQ